MRRAWTVALVVGLGLLGPGCFFQKVNQRLAAQPEPRSWDGRVDVFRNVTSWDDEAVGVGVATVFQRVDATTWRGPGGNYTVDGRFLRGPNVVAELIETEEGWDVRVSGPSAGQSGYWEFLRQREPDPAAQGLVRVARVKRQSWIQEADDGVFVRPEQADASLPWPQLGLAMLAQLGSMRADALPSGLGRPAPQALAFHPREAPRVEQKDGLSHAQRMQRLKEHWARPQPPAGPQQQQRPPRPAPSTQAQ